MRQVMVPLAAALLALTIAGPAAAEPVVNNPYSHLWDIDCSGAVTHQNGFGVPGWNVPWAPGDTPWLVMSETVDFHDGRPSITDVAPRGLEGRLFGPCTAEGADGLAPYSIRDAYFLIPGAEPLLK
jgi:hypothetical protein